MNILYIGYWGANEGLSEATIYPHLQILTEFEHVSKVIYVSIERAGEVDFRVPKHNKLLHIPLKANRTPIRILNKLYELISFNKQLQNIAKNLRVDLVICRSSLAGNYGLHINRRLNIPFTVESFEPHADYMAELNVWSRNGPSYLFQKRQEERQKKYAYHLYPVAENYTRKLIEEGVSANRVSTLPCAVNLDMFSFNQKKRLSVRKKYGIKAESLVGIYVGKFGGIYLSHRSAFDLFKSAHDCFEDFKLILLTPEKKESILHVAREVLFPIKDLIVTKVPHNKVPDYLCASDFAFSLHYPSDSMKYVSPIKNGEYWAVGLPVIINDGIGDDSNILKETKKGSLIEVDNHEKSFEKIKGILNEPSHRSDIRDLAVINRSFSRVHDAYESIISKLKS